MRLLLNLRGWPEGNIFAPWHSCLSALVPALIARAEAEGIALHVLVDGSDPARVPALQRRFAHLHRTRRLHVLSAPPETAPGPASALIEAHVIRGLDPDLVLCPGGLTQRCDPAWLAQAFGDAHPLLDLKSAEWHEKFTYINQMDHCESAEDADILLSLGASDGAQMHPATDLIAAFAALPDAVQRRYRLVLAGPFEGAQAEALSAGAATHGLRPEQVSILPDLSEAEADMLMQKTALLVDRHLAPVPSGTISAALAQGIPVLGPRQDWLSAALGGTEGLYDVGRPGRLAQALKALLGEAEGLSRLRKQQNAGARSIDWSGSAGRLLRAALAHAPHKDRTSLPDWPALQARLDGLEAQTLTALQGMDEGLDAAARAHLARALTTTRRRVEEAHRAPDMTQTPDDTHWRVEGQFDSAFYSLSAVNRETARALTRAGRDVGLFSAEGHGPLAPNEAYLLGHPDLAPLRARAEVVPARQATVLSRNMYPPRCDDMEARHNLLHGYAWEETGFPADYVRDFNANLQGALVTSPHVKRVLINAGVQVPLAVVGNGLDHIDVPPAAPPFEMPQCKYLILHVSSCFPRKGPDALLAGFAEAFSGDAQAATEVCLLIKTTDTPHNTIAAQIADLRVRHPVLPPIRVQTEDLSPGQMRGLYEAADLVLIPSRAEGFCLPVAEAVLAGTPVLTTGWSGQMLFAGNPMVGLIEYSFAKANSHLGATESVWAEPDVIDMARALRAARQNPATEAEKTAGAAALRQTHSWDRVAEASIAAAARWQKAPPAPPARIGWVSTWGTRCGIATYSGHLLQALPDEVALLANHSDDIQHRDSPQVRRCWVEGKDDPLEDLRDAITAAEVDVVVIQFNYGFFNFAALGRLILWLKSTGRRVVLMMHGTDDGPHLPENQIAGLQAELALCDRLLVHSVHDMNRLKALGLVDNVALFPHGVPERWATPQPTVAADAPIVLGTYGFLLPHKGYPELIEALALMRQAGHDVSLRMVNAAYPAPVSADLEASLRRQIANLDLAAHVDLCSYFLSDTESVERLSEAHLLVFPYRHTSESASGAVRQALAVSRPIAVTPQPIFDDVSGLVLPLPGFSPADMAIGLGAMVHDLRSGSDTSDLAQSLARAAAWRSTTGYGPLAGRLWAMLQALCAD